MAFDFVETFTLEVPDLHGGLSNFSESSFREGHGLVVEIAAIHAGATKNLNLYTEEELEKSINTWVQPYLKPIILNHDLYVDPIGRVVGARMSKESDGTPVQMLQAAITDPSAIQKVNDKRFLTGSVGGRSKEAHCTICNVDWAAPREAANGLPCKHQRGKVYNGKVAMMEMVDIAFHEYSIVNLPADSASGIRSIGESEDADDDWHRPVRFFVLGMTQESITELTESEDLDVLSEMKKKDASSLYMSMKGAFIETQVVEKIRPEKYESEKVVKSYQTLTSTDELVETDLEEKAMSDKGLESPAEDDDILAVSEELINDDVDDASSETDTEEGDKSEGVSDEVETPEEESSVKEEEEVEEGELTKSDEDEVVEPEASDATETEDTEDSIDEVKTEEEVVDTEVEESDESAEDEQTSSEESEDTVDSELGETNESTELQDERDEKIDALEEENRRLRSALHRMLVERVVDAKIAVGVVNSDARKDAIADHAERTASSLADSLRDLQEMAPVSLKVPSVTEEFVAVEDEHSEIEEADAEESNDEPKADVAEEFFTDVFMGRKKIFS